MRDDWQQKVDAARMDHEQLTQLYLQLRSLEKELSTCRRQCAAHLMTYLHANEIDHEDVGTAYFYIVQPKPRASVDEKAWKDAVCQSPELQRIEKAYLGARAQYEKVKKTAPYLSVREKES